MLLLLVLWLPPKDWRKSDQLVAILDVIDETQRKVDVNNELNPYKSGQDHSNKLEKELSEGNKDGVIKFNIPQILIEEKGFQKVRLKLVNADYVSTKYSPSVSLAIH